MPRFGLRGTTQSFSARPLTPGPTCRWAAALGRKGVRELAAVQTNRTRTGAMLCENFSCKGSESECRPAPQPQGPPPAHLDHHCHAVVPRHKRRLHHLAGAVHAARLDGVPAQSRSRGVGWGGVGVDMKTWRHRCQGSRQGVVEHVSWHAGRMAAAHSPAGSRIAALPSTSPPPPPHPLTGLPG